MAPTDAVRFAAVAVAAGALLGGARVASAQDDSCGEWTPSLFPYPSVDGEVHALQVFDALDGPVLVLGGEFDHAFGVRAECIVQWDGRRFAPLGSGLSGGGVAFHADSVEALATFDDGTGEALYAGGVFRIDGERGAARWDGVSWSSIGDFGGWWPSDLAVFDDGSGPALYAAGPFVTIDGVPIRGVARFDGESWSALGTGIDNTAFALCVHDDGSGPALYVGGAFRNAGGTLARGVARWNGASWSAVGEGLGDREVEALAVHDFGSGPDLFATGRFDHSGATVVRSAARWDGVAWSPLGAGLIRPFGPFGALESFDDGAGPVLFASGDRIEIPGDGEEVGLVRWDGSAWTKVGLEPSPYFSELKSVRALAVFDDGGGPRLVAGGRFVGAGGRRARNVAAFDGAEWRALSVTSHGLLSGVDGEGAALAVFDDGRGPALYVGGEFQSAGAPDSAHVARWDGTDFEGTGIPIGPANTIRVEELLAFDDGTGSALYVGGAIGCAGFPRFAQGVSKFDGASWSTLPVGAGCSEIHALGAFDLGSGLELVAGGDWDSVGLVARWDGSAFVSLGSGLSRDFTHAVRALALFDDGTGPALYVGGKFTSAGGVSTSGIARWDGASWSDVGGGIPATVLSLAVHDDGSGPALYAGGDFAFAGGVATSGIARFDGVSWAPVGEGVHRDSGTPYVAAMTVFDDGTGPVLVAGGAFDRAGSVFGVNGVSQWDGDRWRPLWTGFGGGIVEDFAVFDDGAGPALYAAGTFRTAGGVVSANVARWARNDTACRRGNVGGASPTDVLFVNGEAGRPGCRRVIVAPGAACDVSIAAPASRHFALWVLDGPPRPGDVAAVRFRTGGGAIVELGEGCRPLPSENLVTPGAVPCPFAVPRGVTSRRLGPATSRTVCLDGVHPVPRAPVTLPIRFPHGTFTLGGLIADPASAAAKPFSIMNWVIVTSM